MFALLVSGAAAAAAIYIASLESPRPVLGCDVVESGLVGLSRVQTTTIDRISLSIGFSRVSRILDLRSQIYYFEMEQLDRSLAV